MNLMVRQCPKHGSYAAPACPRCQDAGTVEPVSDPYKLPPVQLSDKTGQLPPESKFEAGQEQELQKQIAQYLRLHGIWFDCDSMVKRRRGTVGTPDFLFCYRGIPIGCEAKTSTGKLSPDQVAAHEQMRANGWRIIVARSVEDLQKLMREIDTDLV